MEKVSRLPLLFAAILLMVIWGFYRTYFSLFPEFPNIKTIHHFHGLLFLLWFALLIVQPILITTGRATLHKLLGKFSYVLVPLIVISTHLVAQNQYRNDLQTVSIDATIANQLLPFSATLAFVILYLLAMANRSVRYKHMRYIIMTSLILVSPGLGRVFILWFGSSFPQAVINSFLVADGILLALILGDVLQKRNYRPYLVGGAVILASQLAWFFMQYSTIWQRMGGYFASVFF